MKYRHISLDLKASPPPTKHYCPLTLTHLCVLVGLPDVLRDELDPLEGAGHPRQRGLLLRRRGRGGGLCEDKILYISRDYVSN